MLVLKKCKKPLSISGKSFYLIYPAKGEKPALGLAVTIKEILQPS
jgi:hypothetical protein